MLSALRTAAAMLLIFSLFTVGLLAQAPAQTQLDDKAQKAKAKIERIGRNGDLTVKTVAGREFYGSVKDIGVEQVTIREVDLHQDIEVLYSEVKSVDKGYGQARSWNGKRIPPKKHLFGILIATGLLAAIVIVVAASKD